MNFSSGESNQNYGELSVLIYAPAGRSQKAGYNDGLLLAVHNLLQMAQVGEVIVAYHSDLPDRYQKWLKDKQKQAINEANAIGDDGGAIDAASQHGRLRLQHIGNKDAAGVGVVYNKLADMANTSRLLLLSPAVLISDDAIDAMMRALSQRGTGAVSCQIRYNKGDLWHPSWINLQTPWKAFMRIFRLHNVMASNVEHDYEYTLVHNGADDGQAVCFAKQATQQMSVWQLPIECLMIRKSDWDMASGLDDDFSSSAAALQLAINLRREQHRLILLTGLPVIWLDEGHRFNSPYQPNLLMDYSKIYYRYYDPLMKKGVVAISILFLWLRWLLGVLMLCLPIFPYIIRMLRRKEVRRRANISRRVLAKIISWQVQHNEQIEKGAQKSELLENYAEELAQGSSTEIAHQQLHYNSRYNIAAQQDKLNSLPDIVLCGAHSSLAITLMARLAAGNSKIAHIIGSNDWHNKQLLPTHDIYYYNSDNYYDRSFAAIAAGLLENDATLLPFGKQSEDFSWEGACLIYQIDTNDIKQTEYLLEALPRLAKLGLGQLLILSYIESARENIPLSNAMREKRRKRHHLEQEILSSAKKNKIVCNIVRFSQIYGLLPEGEIKMIADFIHKFGFFPIYPPARSQRQPLHIDDLAEALLQLIAESSADGSAINRAFAIAGTDVVSYSDMVKAIFAAYGLEPVTPQMRRLPLLVNIMRLVSGARFWASDNSILQIENIWRMNVGIAQDSLKAQEVLGFSSRLWNRSEIMVNMR